MGNDRGEVNFGTLIHMSMTAPLDLLTLGKYSFAAISKQTLSGLTEEHEQTIGRMSINQASTLESDV